VGRDVPAAARVRDGGIGAIDAWKEEKISPEGRNGRKKTRL